ncbi:hypothetical protein Tco_1173523 [Tanacetum coccineum]
MVESSSQNPSSPNRTPKEELVTLNKPNSPNLFLLANQVEFTFDEMLFTSNNEVARIHPDHPNSVDFQIVSDFISKCCLSKAFIRGIIGEIGNTTFRNAIGAHYLDTYVDSPSLVVVRPWFAEIGYNREIGGHEGLQEISTADADPDRESEDEEEADKDVTQAILILTLGGAGGNAGGVRAVEGIHPDKQEVKQPSLTGSDLDLQRVVAGVSVNSVKVWPRGTSLLGVYTGVALRGFW